MLKQIDQWHKTRWGYLVFGLVELVIAYGFASLMIDRGNLWWYLLALIFFLGFLSNIFKFLGTFFHRYGKKSK